MFRQFMAQLTARLRRFMVGRYGTDRLNMSILGAGLAACLISSFFHNAPINLLLTVEGSGLIDGKNYSLNRVYTLGVNSARSFCTQYARFTGTVISIG